MKHIQKQKNILFSVLMMVVLSSCFTLQSRAEETSTTIVCTNSILADFTSNILTDNVTIEYIMPAGVCPAHFDTSPSDVSLITSADIIISLGWEPWLESLLVSSGNTDVKQIKCSQLGEWNIPSGAIKYVEKIRDEISLLLPEYNDTIQANAQAYLTEINGTAEYLQSIVISNGSVGKEVICMQWQKDFVEWLDLNVTYSYMPPESLSVQDELDIINAASSGDICAVIDNLQSGTDFGARIASESGASHIIFTNFPGAIPGTDTYLEMIIYNANQLTEGIEAYEYKQGGLQELESQISGLEVQRNASLAIAAMFGILTCVFVVMYKKK
jgi:ABC-type Zn uptake system ZnuABC Zn-binding protein ZnuA